MIPVPNRDFLARCIYNNDELLLVGGFHMAAGCSNPSLGSSHPSFRGKRSRKEVRTRNILNLSASEMSLKDFVPKHDASSDICT